MQSRAMSLVESVANIIVGFAIAVLAQMIVFPLFGITASFAQNLGVGIAFTAVSLARSYALRRMFDGLSRRRMGRDTRAYGKSSTAGDPVPDLFAGARDEGEVPRAAPAIPQTVLPADLPAALTRLPESDLKRLEEALAIELRRRNLVTAPAARGAPVPENPKSKRKVPEPVGRGASAGPALTPGKVNAIRAAVKAGVKPMAIARQFGVSLSAIKNALEDKR